MATMTVDSYMDTAPRAGEPPLVASSVSIMTLISIPLSRSRWRSGVFTVVSEWLQRGERTLEICS